MEVQLDDIPITLDRRSFVPFYEQIAVQVRNATKANKLRANEVFLSERELAEKLGISKLPVKRAYEKLRAEGLLVTAKGKRPVIGRGADPWNVDALWSFTEEIRRRGLTSSAQLLALDLCDPDPEVAAALRLQPSDQVYCIKRVRFVEEEPLVVETTNVPAVLFPKLEMHDLESRSLYEVIEVAYGHKLERAEERIGAVSADEDEATLLAVPSKSPLVSSHRLVYDICNTPVEYGLSLFRADRYVARIISFRRNVIGP